ncbi:PQQ-binding-like beta-propeller repeat protein [Haloarcula marina]|uniref:outer membrane protein assembly factor BamB family protein n=1 Tax=Haloarcula marina TaxID=2961574 RepID=UPI0020B789DA|nr:PQQ-binding-like beta-propeller repeat protein [Halomicroarcula marina]
MAKGSPNRWGYQPESAPQTGLSEQWQGEAGPSNIVQSGLSVSGGRVFTVGRYTLRAFDSRQGTLEWTQRQPDQFAGSFVDDPEFEFIQSGPTVSGERVFSVSSVTLYERNATSGETGWAFRTNSSFDHVLPVGNVVFAGVSIDGENQLVALDQSTGLRQWTQSVNEVPMAFGWADDPGSETTLLVTGRWGGSATDELVARDPTDGTVLWRTSDLPPEFVDLLLPAVGRGRVYAGGNGVTAFNTADGSVAWTVETSTLSPSGTPVTNGDRVYITGPNTAVCVDASSGEELWSTTVEGTSRLVSPVVTDDMLYLAAGPTVVALDTADGTEQFRHTVSDRGELIHDLASVAGYLYVRIGNSIRAFTDVSGAEA